MASETSLSLGKHLRKALLDAGIDKLLKGGIYPLLGDDKPMPCISYGITGMESPANNAIPPDKCVMMLHIFAEDYDKVCEISEAVREALPGLRTPLIRGARIINQADAADTGWFAKYLTLKILTTPIL